jgi:hypothetical protein
MDVQQVLFENTARVMGDALAHIKQRHIDNCIRADPAYGAGVAKALGMTALAAAGDPAARRRWLISLLVGGLNRLPPFRVTDYRATPWLLLDRWSQTLR